MHWLSSESLLPDEGQEVITYCPYSWGLRKGYYSNGRWFDVYHRPIDVLYWKPGRYEESSRGVSRLQYSQAWGTIQGIIYAIGC
jgi:hypothetical protein